MKKLLCLLVPFAFVGLLQQQAHAQGSEFGISLGLSTFYGDLGGANNIGRPLFFDFEGSQVRPVGSLVYRKIFNKYMAFKLAGSFTVIGGDDKLIQPKYEYSPEWYRWYRNMNFKTNLGEVSGVFEFNLLKYTPGSKKSPFTPYLFGGFGGFYYDPKAFYNGGWVRLKPLHTEGEGFPGNYPASYSNFAICFPIGFGVHVNLTQSWTLSVEYGDRITMTDYIDDVSTVYVAQDVFNANLPAGTAQTAWDLSVRSDEIDPEGLNSYITSPGQQRGDPKNKDQYIFTGVITLAYFIPSAGGIYRQHFENPKNQISCMRKWKH